MEVFYLVCNMQEGGREKAAPLEELHLRYFTPREVCQLLIMS